MDHTYEICPTNDLAHDAVAQVRSYPDDTLLAIRGYTDEDGKEHVHCVSPCPDPDNAWRYAWGYELAGAWLADYERWAQHQ